MIQTISQIFSCFSNSALSSKLNHLPKYYPKYLLSTNSSRLQEVNYAHRKFTSSDYVDRLYNEKVDFNSITNGDPVLQRKLKLIILEIENERLSGNPVPKNISEKHYANLLNLDDVSDRKIYLMNLNNDLKQRKINSISVKHSSRHFRPNLIHNHIYYSLGHNTMHSYDSFETSDLVLDCSACTGLMYGDNIVIDLSYEDSMEFEELRQCAIQIKFLLQMSRRIINPFNIHFCNVQHTGKLMGLLRSFLKKDLNDFLVNVHENSYLDLFDRNRLVYLSPNAEDELVEYNPYEIYIIGGLVDRRPIYPTLSLNKVKKENLKTKRFPVFEYLGTTRGSQSFGIDTSFQVIAAMSYFQNWDKAFEYLPEYITEKPNNRVTKFKWRNLHSALDDASHI